jgi:hypothetical protein
MLKILAIVVGIAAGAGGAWLIVIALALLILVSGSRGWGDVLGFYAVGSYAAALLGGVLGAVSGFHVAQGRVRRGLVTFGGSMAAVLAATLLFTAGAWVYVHRPPPGPSKRDKERWAAARGTLDPQLGLQLAHRLLDCHARVPVLTPEGLELGGCKAERLLLSPNTRTSYDDTDNGWRWQAVTSPRSKIVVRPDLLLPQPGPLFEFGAERLLVRRESPDAPPFAVDSPLPTAEVYRQCLSASGVDGCRHWERQRGPAGRHRGGTANSHAIVLEGTDGRRLDVTLFPRGGSDQGKFELHVDGRGRSYVFFEGDGWRVINTPDTVFVTLKSPQPERCELDPTVPCATDAR